MAIEEDRTGTWHAYGGTMSGKSTPRLDCNPASDLHKPNPVAGNSRFSDYLAVHFPEVAATIDETDFGRLHLEVSALKMATHNAIQKRDWPTVRRHFAFIDNVLEAAGTELHDAIGVSYLVNLFYNETSIDFAKARTLMPKRLAAALEIMERHYEDLA
jgi:hypothetical protein